MKKIIVGFIVYGAILGSLAQAATFNNEAPQWRAITAAESSIKTYIRDFPTGQYIARGSCFSEDGKPNSVYCFEVKYNYAGKGCRFGFQVNDGVVEPYDPTIDGYRFGCWGCPYRRVRNQVELYNEVVDVGQILNWSWTINDQDMEISPKRKRCSA